MSLSNFEQALLSHASYSNLTAGAPADELARQLQARGNMAAAQAQLFASQFEVVDQYDGAFTGELRNPLTGELIDANYLYSTGLSATVFKRRGVDTGERFLAIRGTDGWLDVANDLLFVAGIGSATMSSAFLALRNKVSSWLNSGTLPSSGFTVSGHSLGGYLAVALANYQPAVTKGFLFNTPGEGGFDFGFLGDIPGVPAWVGKATNALEWIRAIFGGIDNVPASTRDKLYNFVARADGIDPSLVSDLGEAYQHQTAVYIENQGLAYFWRHHSIRTLTEGLAVQDLFRGLKGPG